MGSAPEELNAAPRSSARWASQAACCSRVVSITTTSPWAAAPRLLHGTPAERNSWRLVGDGEGVHWPDLDEDVSAENLTLGRPSRESQTSFARWLQSRPRG